MSHCTNCAVHVGEGWKFCAGCGAGTDMVQEGTGHHCVECGLPGDDRWTYCSRCGTARELSGARSEHCVSCGAAKNPAWTHCAICGMAGGDHALDGHHCTGCGRPTAQSWSHCGTCGVATALAGRPDGQYCNQCGIRTSNEWTCCAGCGTALLTPDDARNAHDAHCVACGVRGDDSWRHCPACGEERPSSTAIAAATGHFCIECGSRCDDSWSNCAVCGHEVTPEEVAAPTLIEPAVAAEPPPPVADVAPQAPVEPAPPADTAPRVIEPPVVEPAPAPPAPEPVGVHAPPPSPPAGPPTDEASPSASEPPRQRVARELAPRGDMIGAATQVLSLAAAFLGALCVLGLFRLNRELDTLGRDLAAGEEGNVASVNDAEQMLERVFQPMFLIAAVSSLIGLSVWARRRHARALSYGVVEPSLTSSWVGTSFFVPFANIVVPKQGIEETWRASTAGAPNDPHWHERRTSLWIPVWRLFAIVGIGVIVVGSLLDATSIEKSIDANTWSAIGYAVVTLSFLAAIVVVSSINHLQMQRDHERVSGSGSGSDDTEYPELLATIGGASEH